MVNGVANVGVPAQDVDQALDFYHHTLDFSLVKRDGPWAEIDVSGLNVGNAISNASVISAETKDSGNTGIRNGRSSEMAAAVQELFEKHLETPKQITEDLYLLTDLGYEPPVEEIEKATKEMG